MAKESVHDFMATVKTTMHAFMCFTLLVSGQRHWCAGTQRYTCNRFNSNMLNVLGLCIAFAKTRAHTHMDAQHVSQSATRETAAVLSPH